MKIWTFYACLPKGASIKDVQGKREGGVSQSGQSKAMVTVTVRSKLGQGGRGYKIPILSGRPLWMPPMPAAMAELIAYAPRLIKQYQAIDTCSG